MDCCDCKTPMIRIEKSQFYNAQGEPQDLETEVYKCPRCGTEQEPEE